MATLQTIRKRAGVLISIVIGLALLSFILGDFLTKNKGQYQNTEQVIAEIGGEKIPYQVFQNKIEILTENYKRNSGGQATIDEATADMIREQAWEELIQEAVMGKQFEELGLNVHPDELFDMVQGNNIDPQIMQIPIFQNQQTGMFDRNLVIQFLQNLDKDPTGEARLSWMAFEQSLIKSRINKKYNNLIKKGLYVTTSQAKQEANDKNHKVNINIVAQRYDAVPDSAITITKKDLEKYYNEHKQDYKQEASRDIEYIYFDVIPSEKDYNIAKEWINDIKPQFENTLDDIQFVNYNADSKFDHTFYKQGELPELYDSLMFAADTGFLYGPFFEAETYKLAKLSRIEMLPDSVHARHILIQPSENLPYERAKQIADSLKTLIENGADFAAIAKANSADKSNSDKGGDLEWFKDANSANINPQTDKVMVQPFSDTCFFSNTGEIKIVETRFGIHIIEVLEKSELIKKVQVAVVDRKVEPSTETYQNIYAKVSKFRAENNTKDKFNDAVNADSLLTKRVASNLKETDKNIPGIESPRELVRWAYGAEKNDISPIFELGNRFVIAVLTEVREKGIAPLEQVEAEVELNVKKDKKAEKLIAKYNELLSKYNSLEEIAQQLGVDIREANDVNFASFTIPALGVEPAVIAYAVATDENKISEPVKGMNGVYLLKVLSSNVVEESDFASEQIRMLNGLSSRVDYQVFEALKKSADILDNRAKYF